MWERRDRRLYERFVDLQAGKRGINLDFDHLSQVGRIAILEESNLDVLARPQSLRDHFELAHRHEMIRSALQNPDHMTASGS